MAMIACKACGGVHPYAGYAVEQLLRAALRGELHRVVNEINKFGEGITVVKTMCLMEVVTPTPIMRRKRRTAEEIRMAGEQDDV
jgi:hypothetical protein